MRDHRSMLAACAAAVLVLAAAVTALPLLAQGHGPRPSGPAADGPEQPGEYLLARLARYLDLTDEQRAQAREIYAAAHAQAAPLRDEVRDLAMQLRDALDDPAPDPAAVGALVIAIHGDRARIRDIRAAALDEFVGILSEVQRLRLDALRDARRIFGRHRLWGAGDEPEAEPADDGLWFGGFDPGDPS